MKVGFFMMLVLVAAPLAFGQDDNLSLDDLVQGGAAWLKENVDKDALRAALSNVDQAQAQQLFRALQQRFQGEYVIDLAELKQTAQGVLPLLEAHPETRPYAAWLRTRLDYFDVAEQFELTIPPPKVEPGQPPKPRPNPSPERQRQVWEKQLEKRPAPQGAVAWAERLKPVFAAQHVPSQLVWLAEVESSFDPHARSPVGAAGLFQLMPQTAQSLGLSLRPQDQRLEPIPSAKAAAQYLKRLYGRFESWPLALAAYNAGEGRVNELLNRYHTRTFDGIATHLPAETQMYVPKVNATIERRTGVPLAQLPAPTA